MKTIYHLAISRLKYNKGRSLLTIVAITLMTTLLMSIGSSALTIIRHQQLEIAENARNYHAAFKGTTTDQIFILENHTDVESLSTRESVASIELPKLNAFLNFDSIRKGSIDQIQLADGKMPAEVDEIAGPPALFERLGVVPKIGQRFQLPLRIQGGKVENFDFTITGILEQADISKLNVNETRLVYGAFVSEKFVEQHIAPEDRAYTAYIRIVNENKHSKDEIETIISEIAEDVGLNKSDISFNEQYLTYMTNPRNTRKKCYDWTWIGGGISWWHGNLQHLLCFCHFQYTRDGEAKGSWCYQKTYSPLTIYRKPCTVFYRNPLWNLTWIPGNRILVQNGYSFRFYP